MIVESGWRDSEKHGTDRAVKKASATKPGSRSIALRPGGPTLKITAK
ncbi:MAG: hypothetical protein U1F59_07895 [Candidatus Competibacteraceae bacterium]